MIDGNDQRNAQRPKCPKCRGTLIPYRPPTSDRITSVSCINCGHIIDRDNRRRIPGSVERNVKGRLPGHNPLERGAA